MFLMVNGINKVIINNNVIVVNNIKIVDSSYKNKSFKTLLINDLFLLKGRDFVNFSCNKCCNTFIEQFGHNKKFLSGNILCKSCKQQTTMINKYGIKSSFSNVKTRNKIKQTNLQQYGVENVFQSERIKDKIKQTNLQRYGVEYPIQSEKFKEKMYKTNLQKYNHKIAYGYGTKEFKENMINKYGVEHAMQNKKIKFKSVNNQILKNEGIGYSSNNIRNKALNTNLQKYGVKYPIQLKKFKIKQKNTNLEKYGVENPMQVPEFHNKAMSSFNRKMKLKQINENLHYQSIPELNFINECLNNNIEVWDGPSIPYYLDGKKHIYHVDFETNRWIVEIKGKHKWYYRDLESGVLGAKNEAAEEYAGKIGKEFKFILK